MKVREEVFVGFAEKEEEMVREIKRVKDEIMRREECGKGDRNSRSHADRASKTKEVSRRLPDSELAPPVVINNNNAIKNTFCFF